MLLHILFAVKEKVTGVVSQFDKKCLLLVFLSAARLRTKPQERKSKDPETLSFSMPFQGILSGISFSPSICFAALSEETVSVELPDAAFPTGHFRDLSTRPWSHSLLRTRSR